MKFSVINNEVYLGGPNMYGTSRIDAVVGLKERATADTMYGLAHDIIEAGSTQKALDNKDIVIGVDQQTDILLDAGVPGQSLIMEEAMQIVDDAEERLLITAPLLLTGAIGDKVEQAMARGVVPYIVTNDHSNLTRFRLPQKMKQWIEQHKRPADFFAHQLTNLHAKVLASEKSGIVGSHNFSRASVSVGTAEIVLVRHDPAFAAMLGDLVFRQL